MFICFIQNFTLSLHCNFETKIKRKTLNAKYIAKKIGVQLRLITWFKSTTPQAQ